MRWLKLYTEILDDPKIRILAFEDRWHYVALLCCKAEGLQDERDGIWERLLRVKLGLAEVEFDSLKKRLLDVYLIDDNWNPIGWEKRQGAKDEKGAERQRKYREKLKKRNVTHNVTPTSQVEVEVEVEVEKDKNPLSGKPDYTESADRIICLLNQKASKRYRLTKNNRDPIIARLKQGFTESDCAAVITNRVMRWAGTEQAQYLRPDTLFRPSKFESYLNDGGETGMPGQQAYDPERTNRMLREMFPDDYPEKPLLPGDASWTH